LVVFRKKVDGARETTLARFVARAQRAAGLHGSVDVLVIGSRDIRDLNRRFRRQDKPTDVLSFPPVASLARGFAGDVVISADIAAENARRLGHAPADELKVLALHGVLHLAGYDHEHDHGEMARKEARLRRALRLPAALTERTGVASVAPTRSRK
jgi:probable rRNA maturation factor